MCMHVGIRVREGEERERKKNAFDLLRTKIVKTRKLDGNYICCIEREVCGLLLMICLFIF